jgi:hypothetical protein
MTESSGSRKFALKAVRLLLTIALFLAALAPAMAISQTYTYTYTGDQFWYVGGWGLGGVSGYFTLSSPLKSNRTYSLEPDTLPGGTIIDYSFTDGRTVWDLANFVAGPDAFGVVSVFSLTTDKDGIQYWDFNIDNYTGPIIGWPCPGYPYCSGGFVTTKWEGQPGDGDGTNVYGNYNGWSSYPNYWTGLGTWTGDVSSTPEPASLGLVGMGLLGIAGVLRRK